MKDFRINWQLPAQPLGPAVRVEPEKKEDPFLSFQAGDFDWVIRETINGAADRKVRQEAHAPCEADLLRPAAPPFKVGDRVKVCLTWIGTILSFEYGEGAMVGEWDDGGGPLFFRLDSMEHA